jgi:hypothetical protein
MSQLISIVEIDKAELIAYAEATGSLLCAAEFLRNKQPSPEVQAILNQQILEAADRYERKTR